MWVLAVSLMPLATYSAINFTSVLFALLAAAIFLREPVGIHRIVSILVGFVGALIVLTPGETPSRGSAASPRSATRRAQACPAR